MRFCSNAFCNTTLVLTGIKFILFLNWQGRAELESLAELKLRPVLVVLGYTHHHHPPTTTHHNWRTKGIRAV